MIDNSLKYTLFILHWFNIFRTWNCFVELTYQNQDLYVHDKYFLVQSVNISEEKFHSMNQ